MAKRVAPEMRLESWSEVDLSLRKIAECALAIDMIEAEMNMKINDAKMEGKKLSEPLNSVIKEHTKLIKDFTEGHRAELDGKSCQLMFGCVGFRQARKAIIPEGKEAQVVENLKGFRMEDCISVTERVNKDVLKTYDESEITKVGAIWKITDSFLCEPDKEKVR